MRWLLTCVLVSILGCELPFPVPPQPQPGPNPPFVVADATLIVIEETADRTPETATVLGDIGFWSGLGVRWRFYDQDSADAVVYLSMVAQRPGLIVLDKAGKKVWSGPLPKTTDEVRKLVR